MEAQFSVCKNSNATVFHNREVVSPVVHFSMFYNPYPKRLAHKEVHQLG